MRSRGLFHKKEFMAHNFLFIFLIKNTGAPLAEGKGVQVCPAIIWKLIKMPYFYEKWPDCFYLWFKSQRKISKIFPCVPFRLCVADHIFIEVLSLQETFLALKNSWLRPSFRRTIWEYNKVRLRQKLIIQFFLQLL